MADDKSSDVLMMLVLNGQAISADCRSAVSYEFGFSDDMLMDGFEEGYFFEIGDLALQMTAPAPDGKSTGRQSAGVHLEDISVTRQIDRASMGIMDNCINAVGFDSATIVKRRAGGGGAVSGLAYVRYDFTGVLITKIDWTDEHIVKERITFITRALTVQYRPQMTDGDLGDISQAQFVVPVGNSD